MSQKVPEYVEFKTILKNRLTPKRYEHSLAVADEAYRLAVKYGASEQKAYLAGLLHDVTKNASKEEHLNIFDTFGIMLNAVEANAEKLWHAISGAAYVCYVMGIKDEEIVEAIRYHTTARAGMPLLSKILYLADYTSRDRDYEDVDVIRALVDESLDKAYIYALKYTINDLVDSSRAVHEDTLAAYNETVMEDNL